MTENKFTREIMLEGINDELVSDQTESPCVDLLTLLYTISV